MAKLYEEVKIYNTESMVVFASPDDVLIDSVPRGEISMSLYSSSGTNDGFYFFDRRLNTEVLIAKDFSLVQDESGGSYGLTYKEVQDVLNGLIGVPSKNVGREFASYSVTGNTDATVINTQGVFEKVQCTTVGFANSVGFDVSSISNRATKTSSGTGLYKILAALSLSSNNNRELIGAISVKGSTSPILLGSGKTTTIAASGLVTFTIVTPVELSVGDYVEVFVANNSSNQDITVDSLSVAITKEG